MDSHRWIAHRGYARRFPENTLAAVRGAIAAGARAIEIDVQLSADRTPYLLHDRTLERMCGEPRSLAELHDAELASLRAGESSRFGATFDDEPLASLAAHVAQIARSPGVHAYIEIKRVSLEQFGTDAVLDAVLPTLLPIRSRCTLISFDVGVLHAARSRTAIPVGPVLITWSQRTSEELIALQPSVVFCDQEKLPADGALGSPDYDLAVYEVDDLEVARTLIGRGVRFLETFAIGEMLAGPGNAS